MEEEKNSQEDKKTEETKTDQVVNKSENKEPEQEINQNKIVENKTTVQEPEKKKKSKTPIIITIVVLVLLIACGIGGFFVWKYIKDNETVGTTWGDTYYAYLKEGMQQEDFASKEKYGLQQGMKDVTLQFVEVEENTDPVMIMNYEENDTNYVNVYHINDENKVVNVSYKEPSAVELLYNIELKEYIWYVHVEKANEDLYLPIKLNEEQFTISNTIEDSNTLENIVNENNEMAETIVTEITADITIGKNEETKVEKLDGTTVILSKFDETFVKPELDEGTEISVDLSNIDGLKDAIKETINRFKTDEVIITNEVNNEVTEKVKEIEDIKQEIKDAIEEIEKKEEEERKEQEESKKRAEEEEKKKAENEASSNGRITEDQAKKLAQKIDGTYADEVGYPIGYTLEAMIKDSSGLEYYLFRVRWLVENSHWSTIDGVAISVDGKKWKKVDIYQNYNDGETIQEVYSEGTF